LASRLAVCYDNCRYEFSFLFLIRTIPKTQFSKKSNKEDIKMIRPGRFVLPLLVLSIFVLTFPSSGFTQTTEFSYQGFIRDNGAPASGNYDFEFRLFATANGVDQLMSQQRSNVSVVNGVFSVTLDFGAFPAADRFLEIAVKPSGSEQFVTLAARTKILSTPIATLALNATNATNATSAATLNGLNPGSFIRNSDAIQSGANFNIDGSGTANSFDVHVQYNIQGTRVIGTSGFQNLFLGTNAGLANTNGTSNTFAGIDAGKANTAGSSNSFFGAEAGAQNKGSGNSFFGNDAGTNNTDGAGNSFFGTRSGEGNTSGGANSYFGASTGVQSSTGSENSFFGSTVGFANATGSQNTFFGASTGNSNSTGSGNVFVGHSVGSTNRSGNQNTFVGFNSGTFNLSGSNNTVIGSFAVFGGGGNLTNATAIGYRAIVSQSNSLVLGGIAGQNLGSDTNVGIGTSAPKTKLHVAGGDVFVSSPNGLIITSPNGACWRISVSDTGTLSTTSTTCP